MEKKAEERELRGKISIQREREQKEERGERRERDGDMSIYIPSVHIGSNSTRLNSLYMRLSGKREVMEVGSLNI